MRGISLVAYSLKFFISSKPEAITLTVFHQSNFAHLQHSLLDFAVGTTFRYSLSPQDAPNVVQEDTTKWILFTHLCLWHGSTESHGIGTHSGNGPEMMGGTEDNTDRGRILTRTGFPSAVPIKIIDRRRLTILICSNPVKHSPTLAGRVGIWKQTNW